ncbi:hybrid sensor histidine kinase/response regulator [Simiduia aestuariiviva]|uniref:histidine kinase n=1 Tax=Simiduia aestuariiviva TaxID=1510459 RepID=A0A839UQA2_9GAMM|nr:PAS-domain containing protein [Simiduia aestuariiviva]MBB3168680.1 signal transduction histidine kinase/Na+/proline symporter [Simiduia aestuariiviva]
MLSYFELLLLSLGYLLLLFAIAWWGDRIAESTIRRFKPFIIGLAATIYCSAWSFYGTTAQAAYNGWYFPPTFLGAIVLLVFMAAPLKRLIIAAKKGNATSLADYLAMHFGRSRALAVIVTVICLILLIPYIALQLKAITESFHVLTDNMVHSHYLLDVPVVQDTAFYIAMILGMFAIAFGTRHLDAREHHNGLMIAIAFEALIKITAFVSIAWFVTYNLFDGFADLTLKAINNDGVQKLLASHDADQGFIAATVLGMIAIICLPRQFHVLVVESESERDLDTVRWVVPLYLILFGICILPIAYGGLLSFENLTISAEHFVLRLPLANDRPDLALLAYLGGLSAGSSMVIVACVAMATMISNELVVPVLLEKRWLKRHPSADISVQLRVVRRTIIFVLMLFAYGYYHLFANNNALGAIGLSSFALVAQFAPALWLTVARGRKDVSAVLAGIAIGFGFWCYTLLLPMLVRAGWLDDALLNFGPAGIQWLRPTALLGLEGLSSISHGVIWSLCANIFTVIAFSRWRQNVEVPSTEPAESLPVYQLQALAGKFLGPEQARLALAQYPETLLPQAQADAAYVEFVENMLAGVIGSVSAHHVVEHARGAAPAPLLDETSEIYHFSRELLQASIDNISQGISVVDKNLRLVAWNRRYLELFDYPKDLVHVGRHVADLLRFNAIHLNISDTDDVEEFVQKRLTYMAEGSAYVVKRAHSDGRVLELRGSPMPGGGFVTTFTDITDYQRTLDALEEHRNLLEQRVSARTAELQESNQQLELANAGKTRFLAAAGHDLVQPLNAAKLFTNALLQQFSPNSNLMPMAQLQKTLQHLDSSLHAADSIISELLAIAKLDAGAITPSPEAFHIKDLLDGLQQDFQLQAAAKGLSLSVHSATWTTCTDFKLLRRVLQNLLSNAIRYTEKGRILMSARRRGGNLVVQVWDTGVGIAAEHQNAIFVEFKRLNDNRKDGGLGLGLATVERLCKLLSIEIALRSTPGRGSCFSLTLPLSDASPRRIAPRSAGSRQGAQFDGLKVLCLDNEPAIVEAMQSLLAPWGCDVRGVLGATEAEQLLTTFTPELILADYHLTEHTQGVEVAAHLHKLLGHHTPTIIISADYDDQVKAEARAAGFYFLKKPVKVAALRALMARLLKQRNTPSPTP